MSAKQSHAARCRQLIARALFELKLATDAGRSVALPMGKICHLRRELSAELARLGRLRQTQKEPTRNA